MTDEQRETARRNAAETLKVLAGVGVIRALKAAQTAHTPALNLNADLDYALPE